MSQRYNDNPKRPTLKVNQLGILKIYVFCPKIQQRALGSRESTAGVTVSIYENTPEKMPQHYFMVHGRAQLEHSSHIIKVIVEATC